MKVLALMAIALWPPSPLPYGRGSEPIPNRARQQAVAAVALFSTQAPKVEDAANKPDKVVSISAERFAFSPSRIRLKQGSIVEFIITSDDTDHGFRIPSARIDVAIPQQGRGEVRVRFIAKEKGVYPFECSRACGAGHNLMRGNIVVE